jgi:hypothetical protein
MIDALSQKAISWKLVSRSATGGKVYLDATLGPSSYIYHRLEYPYARAIFQNERLRLGLIASWKDPYEKWWCEALFARPSALENTRAFGLCWTSSWNDEPAWRMVGFGRRHPIVRIRSKVLDLLDAATRFAAEHSGSMFLGRVRYQTENTLKAAAAAVRAGHTKSVTRAAATMLLQKRRAFRFEEEIRLLWIAQGTAERQLWLPVIAKDVIDQILISPHVPRKQQKKIQAGFAHYEVDVLKSLVLHAPQ